MAFRGLFIGIDRYHSHRIDWLSCACRDAMALHALFLDNLGGSADLLIDDEATKDAIAERLTALTGCAEDDTVVIAFSGHGSQTHELVTYDADHARLAETAIPLQTLTEWFAKIPAKRLICILDCCFSGGMGTKVVHVDALPRDVVSEADLLDRLCGEGRLILTASTAQQPAWEMTQQGHGLLTHFVLQALQGADDVRQAGRVSIYRLLEYVSQRVTDGASQFGKPQHPTLRGRIDGDLSWPVFVPGDRYKAAFPEHAGAIADADITSLVPFGFPADLLTCWADSIPSLNALQLAAINDYHLFDGGHLVISAPTSSGKTMIGELAALRGALNRRRAVFLLPLKALVNDKYRYFTRTYSSFGLRVIRATGDIADDVPLLLRGQYDIALLTYEKFAAILLGSPHILDHVGTVVVDEVQMIADRSRGIALEFLLTLLRMRRRLGIEPQLIALSAVIGDTNGLERWLNARLLRRNERPVPLSEGILRADGSFRFLAPNGTETITPSVIRPEYRKGSSQDWIIPLVRRLVKEGKQVIVFRETKGDARGCATYLAENLGLPAASDAIAAIATTDPSLASDQLRTCLAGGVAFHVADLDTDERRVVEEEFRRPNTPLRAIAATTTLAMGINTPTEAVIIAGLEHPGEEPYSVAEYKNMVGRAGRMGFAAEGTSYTLATTAHEEHIVWSRYVTGSPEDIESRFVTAGDPRSLVLRVLASAQRSAHEGVLLADIVDFLEGSFGAYRHQQTAGASPWSRQQLLDAVAELRRCGLVEEGDDQRYHLTQLGRFAGESGIAVQSVINVVEALRPLSAEDINDPTLLAATQLTVELDALFFPLNRRSAKQEPHVWPAELRRQGVAQSVIFSLGRDTRDQHAGTMRAKKAVACLLWITELPMAEIERRLTQFGGSFDGAAGPVRGAAARTRDILPIVVRVVQTQHPGIDFSQRCARLLVRLELGVPSPITDLARFAGATLSRADYLQLHAAGFGTLASLTTAAEVDLLRCLGNDRDKLESLMAAADELRRHVENAQELPSLPLYTP
jgi:helicase